VRASINEIRNFDIKGELEKTIDADGSIRSTFASDPLATPTSVEEIAVSEPVIEAPVPPPEPVIAAEPCKPQAPAFVPPNMVAAAALRADPAEPPSFIPPDAVRQRHG